VSIFRTSRFRVIPSSHHGSLNKSGVKIDGSPESQLLVGWLTALKPAVRNRTCGVHMDMGHGSLGNWQYQRNYISSGGWAFSVPKTKTKQTTESRRAGKVEGRPLKYANVDCLHLFLLLLHIGATDRTGGGTGAGLGRRSWQEARK